MPLSLPFRVRAASLPLRVGLVLLTGLLAACNDDAWPAREPTVLENVDADSVVAWPPRAYALPGDVIAAEVRALRTLYVCSRVLDFQAVVTDSAGGRYARPTARVELPATPDCALSEGLDTVFEASAPAAGQTLYLRAAGGRLTDSVRSVAGTGVVEGFLHLPDDTLTAFSRYVFRDSTAGHPQRTLSGDSLATCEILQAAVYSRLHGGDTLTIRIRTLLASPAVSADTLPACAGVHADTVEVVEDRYGFP